MENKHNYMSIIISVIVAVILLTAIPILTNISTDCPVYNIGHLDIDPDFSSGDYNVDKGSYDYIDSVTIIKDDNLVPENIVKDVNIFGVVGTAETGGGASLDRIALICFSVYTNKTGSTNNTLTYHIGSEMLSKRFFTDGKGNWYLPEDVDVYYGDSYKGKANTTITLSSGTGQTIGKRIDFKVGTTPVALLFYYYEEDFTGVGIISDGTIRIYWGGVSGNYLVSPVDMEFIELSDNFFDDFPYYSDPDVDYWNRENFLPFDYTTMELKFGWNFYDAD
jgi:hypothetical protein